VNILNRLGASGPGHPADEARLAEARARLLQARRARVRPGWDDKVLADWNGLMIAALSRATRLFQEPRWLAAAIDAFDFVQSSMTDAEGRLGHSWRLGRLRHPGTLDDYANMAAGALALFENTGDDRFLAAARRWTAALDGHFWDRAGGGYFLTADDTSALLMRPRHVHDNAVPAGNGTMVGVLARLWLLTGEAAYRDRAEALVSAFSGELERNFFPLATFLNNVELLDAALLLVVVGDPEDPGTRALLHEARRQSRPNLVVMPVASDITAPDGHPAAGKGLVHGRPAAYVCRRMACSPPATDPAALADLLATTP
jgi:uncharacterized protein YyaL (SSP411 family)